MIQKQDKELKDVDVVEISLVDSAANLKKFYLTKRGKKMEKLKELYKEFDIELEDEDVTKAKDIPEDEKEELTDALELFKKYKDDLPDDALESIKVLAKLSLNQPEKVEDMDGLIEELSDFEKAGRKLSKATIKQLKSIIDTLSKMVGERTEKMTGEDTDYNKLPDEVKEKLERLDRIERERKEELEKKEEKEKEKLHKTIEDLQDRLEKMEELRGVKKSKDDEPKDKDKKKTDDEKDDWPSLEV